MKFMDGPGFHVDIESLEQASGGIARSVNDQEKRQLKDVYAGPEAYGDVSVHRAVKHFCDRWNDGLDLLVEDAKEVSDILGRAATAYRAVDNANAASLRGDPGTQVTGD
ncbi:WXG100 family type VII secretion target [Actinoplanes sp. HUAS TT8]|uniref:WXG100 family type VII secretion target n=1 Tax=Actinoplanes sp. HUAS TT8 TaxID=3447453 RepID=UPI003F51C574